MHAALLIHVCLQSLRHKNSYRHEDTESKVILGTEISFFIGKWISFFPCQFPFSALLLAELSKHLEALSHLYIFSLPEIPLGLSTVQYAFPFSMHAASNAIPHTYKGIAGTAK
jgi:hypothetical protein